jgi:tRNA threonylcarbamoyladenosine biosynthesis protein TsaB
MRILAIDTATEACSAAILADGRIVERYREAPREHNRLILPMVESVLAEAGLRLDEVDALAFGRGPGAFTGVRIAAGVAQGLAFGAGLPVVPVSTLAAMALVALDETGRQEAYACIDARMNEVYWGVYGLAGKGSVELLGEECVVPADAVPLPGGGPGVGIGSGWSTYGDVLAERLRGRVVAVLEGRYPRASAVARLAAYAFGRGVALPAEQAQPVYLRDSVAKKPG